MTPMRSLHEAFITKSAIGPIKGLIGPIAMLIVLGLVGCAQPTGYTRASSLFGETGYGYRDKRINGDEFSIVALGNSSTSLARAAEIALLRAAHLTKEEGKTHFVVIKQREQITDRMVPTYAYLYVSGTTIPIPVGERPDQESMAILLIRLLPLQSAYPPDAINADEVIEELAKHFE